MNPPIFQKSDACYQLAEERAAQYFQVLCDQVMEKTYIPALTKDIQSWKQNHIPNPLLSFFSHKKKQGSSKGFYNYMHWLDHKGKLDNYLDRSISYIFMRDLGQALDAPDTKAKIQRVVGKLKNYLVQSNSKNGRYKNQIISMDRLFRLAQKEGIESTFIWLINKLNTVTLNIPKGMDAEEAERKLIKVLVGVMMHVLEEMDDALSSEKRKQKLDEAIRLGYAYGLTYPFIDDLLDAKVLSVNEKKKFSNMIRTTLVTGFVPELAEWSGKNTNLIKYIHTELREAFEYIKAHQDPKTIGVFLEQSYVFFNAQEVDRLKDLANANYSNREIYLPVIIKSAYSRLIVRAIINAPEESEFDNRTFFYGLYNQLADDFADMFEDMKVGSVTPYTYYIKHHDKRNDLINPFQLYWTVITHLIHHVYHSDAKTQEVILSRAINGLKRFKERMGNVKYNEVMSIFATGNSEFNQVIQTVIQKGDDVDFLDKLLRDHMITYLKNERRERGEFLVTMETLRDRVDNILKISNQEKASIINEPIIHAANYSLEGNGKRLRPILTWVMGVNKYKLDESAIVPLLRSLEYMHTASLIFDDLPSQDNASVRRGRQTLHQVYNIAIAELTGLFLTQKAVEEQASLNQFDSKTVLRLIQYSAHTTAEVCKGQAMDLASVGKVLTEEQLNTLCFYKTGIAFEASLVMPAMLAHAEEVEINALKKFAYHAGIAFQIKDDLLDVEGAEILLGKPIGKDVENKSSTFVSVLGQEVAKKAMWEHYCLALEALKEVPRQIDFLKHFINYIVNRQH